MLVSLATVVKKTDILERNLLGRLEGHWDTKPDDKDENERYGGVGEIGQQQNPQGRTNQTLRVSESRRRRLFLRLIATLCRSTVQQLLSDKHCNPEWSLVVALLTTLGSQVVEGRSTGSRGGRESGDSFPITRREMLSKTPTGNTLTTFTFDNWQSNDADTVDSFLVDGPNGGAACPTNSFPCPNSRSTAHFDVINEMNEVAEEFLRWLARNLIELDGRRLSR